MSFLGILAIMLVLIFIMFVACMIVCIIQKKYKYLVVGAIGFAFFIGIVVLALMYFITRM